jgi:hypothetical protein
MTMGRNYLAQYNLFAVSANAAETALNTEQTLDTSLLVDENDILQLAPRREDNSNELTGKEEPDAIYDLGTIVDGAAINFPKAQAQHIAFLLAYGLGIDTPAAYGTGYKHVITPETSMDLPTFTGAMRLGSTILKRRFASLAVDKVTITFAKDAWAKAVGNLKGTGKYTDNVTKETVSAFYDSTSLTLAANGVQGATAGARLDSVHLVRCIVPVTLEKVDVTVTVVSAATPAVLTISAPGGAHTACDFEIIYVPTEAAWCTFPARVTETPLRVTDLTVKVGGKWNGSSFLGGHSMSTEIDSIEYTLDNQGLMEFRPGGTGTYANYFLRQGRQQTLKLDRQARDFILQQHVLDNDTFGVYMKATGVEFETGKNYYAELVFPKCAILKADYKINGKVVAEAGDILVLEDDTYGSVRAEVANKVAAYAA